MSLPRITVLFQKIIGFKLSSLYSNQGGKGIPYNRETQMEKKKIGTMLKLRHICTLEHMYSDPHEKSAPLDHCYTKH